MIVNLTYFKLSGKFYSSDFYETELEFDFEIAEELKSMMKRNIMPGLTNWHGGFYVLVEADSPHGLIKFLMIPE